MVRLRRIAARGQVLPRGTAKSLAAALTMTWRASPVSVAGQVVVALAAGLAPVAAAWLLRAILDDVSAAAAAPGRLLGLAVLLGTAGAVTGLAPNVAQYLSARAAMRAQRQA